MLDWSDAVTGVPGRSLRKCGCTEDGSAAGRVPEAKGLAARAEAAFGPRRGARVRSRGVAALAEKDLSGGRSLAELLDEARGPLSQAPRAVFLEIEAKIAQTLPAEIGRVATRLLARAIVDAPPEPRPPARRPPLPRGGRQAAFLPASTPSFAGYSTGCGWTVRDYVARVYDPSHRTCDEALAGDPGEVADLGFWLSTTSTCTVRLQDGTQRMYFQNPSFGQEDATSFLRYPYFDAAGVAKFGAVDFGSGPVLMPDVQLWWGSEAEDVRLRYFATDYIAFLDASSDGSFGIYAPALEPGTDPDNCWVDAPATFEDASTGFRAGWQSTSIRCAGAAPIYRDVSVLYLPTLGWYAMFAVECLSEVDGEACCTPEACAGGTPETRLVAFVCDQPTFRDTEALFAGPFSALVDQPDPAAGEWFGVPHVIVDPGGATVIASLLRGDIYAAPLGNLELWILCEVYPAFEAALLAWLDGAGVSGLVSSIASPLTRIGRGTPDGVTPTTLAAPTPTDPCLVFDPLGRLNVFFANRSSGVLSDPLDILSRACAEKAYSPGPLTSAAVLDALTTLPMGDCDPLDLQGFSTSSGDQLNDPDVFESVRGNVQVSFHSQPYQGLVYATASTTTAFDLPCNGTCTEPDVSDYGDDLAERMRYLADRISFGLCESSTGCDEETWSPWPF